MFWDRRDRVFLVGTPLALVPAAAFLPLFAYLVLLPPQVHAHSSSTLILGMLRSQGLLLQGLAFTGLVFLQMAGAILVGFASSWGGLRFVTLLAVPACLLLLMIAAYTGIFFAVFAART
jgi:hypothetical protein